MRYLGLDVHSKKTAWRVVESGGLESRPGTIATTVAGLEDLIRLVGQEELLVGQEIGSMSYFVNDVLSSLGVQILSFNAHQLKMISCSRHKTDRRDARWIARLLASGMYPTPVYLPDARIRRLRSLLQQRDVVVRNRASWLLRARGHLRMTCQDTIRHGRQIAGKIEELVGSCEGVCGELIDLLEMSDRQFAFLDQEREWLTEKLRDEAGSLPEVILLQTIPGVGLIVAVTIYAWVGDVGRFPNSRLLCAYSGLVPSVRNSGECNRTGRITKEGPEILRRTLVQAAQAVGSRSRRPEAQPLRDFRNRIIRSSGSRKVATVALARHILRIAYHVLRDGTPYRPELLSNFVPEPAGIV